LEEGLVVQALKVEQVKREFFQAHYADGDTEKAKQNAKRMAFRRALDTAIENGLVAVREVDGVDYIWLTRPENEERSAST
jgi:nucleoside diphosphate kinase